MTNAADLVQTIEKIMRYETDCLTREWANRMDSYLLFRRCKKTQVVKRQVELTHPRLCDKRYA
jgi:hypothetical protein